jgi:AcrR family transcriptional regulator
MPKLWTDTIESHRIAVRDAILDATAALVADRGLRGVTMGEVAIRAGIGRATLYKYFADTDALLRAWHEREVARHVADVTVLADGIGDAGARLEEMLERYALDAWSRQGGHDAELAALLHRDEHVTAARLRLRRLVAGLVSEAVAVGVVRDDVPPDELASYCLAALTAAGQLHTTGAVRRLVGLTLDGLRPITQATRADSEGGVDRQDDR